MKHIDIKEILQGQYVGQTVTVCGWVRTSRDSKNVAFLELNDGSCLKNFQVVLDKNNFNADGDYMHLGAALMVQGKVVAGMQPGTVEIVAAEVTVLGDCAPDYPLQKKRHTLEFLRSMPHLRLRTRTFNAVFRVRSVLSMALHEYFQMNNYVYIHAPLITGSDCEGGGEMFQVTTHGFAPEIKTEEEYYGTDFFGRKAGLSVSGQLEGEVGAMAFGKIYTFGPSFRAENSNTPRHLAEFWHIEPEIAFATLPDVLEVAEDMFRYVIRQALEKCPDELAFFEQFYEPGLVEKLTRAISEKFAVIEYTDAIEALKKSGVAFQYPVKWEDGLQTEHEKYIAEVLFGKPTFVINYPIGVKSFYMKQNDDGKTVAASDLLVPGIGELIGGSEREYRLENLLAAMSNRGMDVESYDDYIALRRYGSTPHGGFGIGLERLMMYVTGMTNIRDVIPYPRAVNFLP
ncbi:MAG TPA: asparagine--tRNA ligase [Anaerolineaceae bacterium]|nr:asparagine--tRNA ligase [Anaerolineaceae bacterium]